MRGILAFAPPTGRRQVGRLGAAGVPFLVFDRAAGRAMPLEGKLRASIKRVLDVVKT